MRSRFYFVLIAMVFATLTISGCTRQVKMTDLSSDEFRAAEQKRYKDSLDGSGAMDSSGKPVLYGDVTGVDLGDEVILDVLFDFDRYSIRPEGKRALDKNVKILNKYKDTRITLEGHCDERGTDEYNIALGERRTNSVRKYLGKLGISSGRLNMISYGEERPFCTDSTEECWRRNRRVHFKISK